MGLPSPSQDDHPSPSALQTLIDSHKVPNGTEAHLYHLALQVAHNLRYQHNWTEIRIHHASNQHRLPRPLLSGLPPQRLYIHPDEQLELLQQQKREGKTGMPELLREREWVLPSHLRERWSLRRFGEVFDGISVVPGVEDGEIVWRDESADTNHDDEGEQGADAAAGGDGSPTKWRISQPKRVLLATLDDDSTVVYYIVHDGIVKPRQN